MNSIDISKIKAVAFDIDGTLYRAWKLNLRMSFYFLSHGIFFLKYGLVRNIMHQTKATSDFIKIQSEHMAKKLKCTPKEAEERLDKIIYKGLEKYFRKIKPCHLSIEFIKKLKASGYKIALLSDFPPEQKGDIWGIRDLCDVVLNSEKAGALKPDSTPFLHLAGELKLPTEEILYVGNNHKYDIVGSKNVGMKSAWFRLPFMAWLGKKSKLADITFWRYKQLYKLFFETSEEK